MRSRNSFLIPASSMAGPPLFPDASFPRRRESMDLGFQCAQATSMDPRLRGDDGTNGLIVKRYLTHHFATSAAALLAVFLASPVFAARQPTTFSSSPAGNTLPAGWQLQPIPKVERQTRFDLVDANGTTVLRARADDAAASLRYTLATPPASPAHLHWRWKTDHVLDKADLTTKSGDDYAARLYVFFDRKPARMSFGERIAYRLGRARYGDQVPPAALCYVWDNKQPVGTLRDNAYTGFVKMVVATTGKMHEGGWVDVQRDIAADYTRAFGTKPPRITGIAISVDTDNTGESTISYFGDISFAGKPATSIGATP